MGNELQMGEHRVHCHMAADLWAGVEAQLAPFFPPGQPANQHWSVQVDTNDQAFGRLLGEANHTRHAGKDRVVVETLDHQPTACWQLDIDRHHLQLAFPASTPLAAAVQTTYRTLRSLLIFLARQQGWHVLHASAFVHAGRCALVFGPKRAGKTSTLLWFMHHKQARYLANDRVLVRADSTRLLVHALPHAVNVRTETLAPLGFNLPTPTTGTSRINISVPALCGWLRCDIQSEAAVDLIIHPSWQAGATGQPLQHPGNPTTLLLEHLLNEVCEHQTHWNGLVEAPQPLEVAVQLPVHHVPYCSIDQLGHQLALHMQNPGATPQGATC